MAYNLLLEKVKDNIFRGIVFEIDDDLEYRSVVDIVEDDIDFKWILKYLQRKWDLNGVYKTKSEDLVVPQRYKLSLLRACKQAYPEFADYFPKRL